MSLHVHPQLQPALPRPLQTRAFSAVLAGSVGGQSWLFQGLAVLFGPSWLGGIIWGAALKLSRRFQMVLGLHAPLRCLGCWLASCQALWCSSPALAQKGELSGQCQCQLSACGSAIAHHQPEARARPTPALSGQPRSRLHLGGKYRGEWSLCTTPVCQEVFLVHPGNQPGGIYSNALGKVVCFSRPPVFLNKISRVGKGEKALPFFHVGDGAQDPKDPFFRVCHVLRTAEI